MDMNSNAMTPEERSFEMLHAASDEMEARFQAYEKSITKIDVQSGDIPVLHANTDDTALNLWLKALDGFYQLHGGKPSQIGIYRNDYHMNTFTVSMPMSGINTMAVIPAEASSAGAAFEMYLLTHGYHVRPLPELVTPFANSVRLFEADPS